jgi:hypothetical protein
LSHWDADHWAGAYATSVNGSYPALSQTWIAPLQSVTPIHAAFAYDVVTAGGRFLIYDPPAGHWNTMTLPHHRALHYGRGSGPDRNGSGLVLAVEDQARSWLLTGDCDYMHFMPSLMPSDPVALVAPHHGASLDPKSPVPTPVASTYRRLVYSFGHQNAHGSKKPPTRHPTKAGVTAHSNAGWRHGTWKLHEAGTSIAGDDVIATCEHLPGTSRGGAVIGWDMAPAPLTDCPVGLCNALCPQR